MPISTADKIEMVVSAFLEDSRITNGHFGKLTVVSEFGLYSVECDGLTVLVRSGPRGWGVQFKGCQVVHPDLYIAARDALEAGAGQNLSPLPASLPFASPTSPTR